MLATVTGTYKNGQIILDEELPVTSDNAKVIVTLVEETVRKNGKASTSIWTFERSVY